MTSPATAAHPTESRVRGVDRAHEIVAGTMAGLVLVLAVMASRSVKLFGTWEIELHGYVGNSLFILALVNGGLALNRRRGELTALIIGMLVFAQIGLGYVGRDSLEAAAWHVPNGVLLMGLTTFQFAQIRKAR
ncbi:MAG TPA: hypothetical protein VMW08_14740 [Acidimicrobiales bacterium]|nr:hypothetical protein [Acidimicrobiales bacterium]